jgi:hypothetical protein
MLTATTQVAPALSVVPQVVEGPLVFIGTLPLKLTSPDDENNVVPALVTVKSWI